MARAFKGIMRDLRQASRSGTMSWKKLSSRIVFDNPWITVLEDRVINPGGGRNDYGHVHFKNKAVAILPLDEQGNTWLVGQDRYTLGTFTWELPMGGAPLAESPLEAARRELREETGLTAAKWTEVMRLHTSNSITDEVGIVFVAEELTEGPSDLDETENIELRKLTLAEALEMIERGEITDAISVAALFGVARRLRR
jgi:8-oxo-dGTP pyrophosphatase MutT (NUDIX family)